MSLPRLLVAAAALPRSPSRRPPGGRAGGADTGRRRRPARRPPPPSVAPLLGRGALRRQDQGRSPSSPLRAPASIPTTDAWVTFDTPLGANNLAAPASTYTNCTISFARWRWPTAASMREDWEHVLHDDDRTSCGHLLGHPHDDDARQRDGAGVHRLLERAAALQGNRPARAARRR